MNASLRTGLIRIAAYGAILLLSAHVLSLAMGWSLMLREQSATSILDMVGGTAEKPFIYRTLVSQLVRGVVAVTPQVVSENVTAVAQKVWQSESMSYFIMLTGWKDFSPRLADPKNLYIALVAMLFMYAAIVIYALTLRRLCVEFFPGYSRVAWGTAFLGLLILPAVFDDNIKIYDFPMLAFMALAMLYMYRRNWSAYLLVFILGCINKEAMLLSTGLFALYYWTRMERTRFFSLVFLQGAIFLTIMAWVHYVYAANPGENFFLRDITIIAGEYLPYYDGYNMLALLFLGWLLIARWPEIPEFLRVSLALVAGDILVYYMLGARGEFRVFFDSFPVMSVIAGYTLLKPLDQPRRMAGSGVEP